MSTRIPRPTTAPDRAAQPSAPVQRPRPLERVESLPSATLQRRSLTPPPTPPAGGLATPRSGHDFGCVRVKSLADAVREPGQPLRPGLSGAAAHVLPTRLGDIRIHTGAASRAAADQLGANAFTIGRHIHFAADQFRPNTPAGSRLLAHEVAHALQPAAPLSSTGPTRVSSVDDRAEVEARNAATSWLAGRPFVPAQRRDTAIYRDAKAGDRKVLLKEGFTGRETEEEVKLKAAAKGWVIEGAVRWDGRNWIGENVREGTGSERAVAQVKLNLRDLPAFGQGLGGTADIGAGFDEESSIYTGEEPPFERKFGESETETGEGEAEEGREDAEASGEEGSEEKTEGTEGTETGTGTNELDPATALASFLLDPSSLSTEHKNTTGESGSPAGGIGFLTGPLAKILTVFAAALTFLTGPVMKLLGKFKDTAKKLVGAIIDKVRRLRGSTPKTLPPGSPPPAPPPTKPPPETVNVPEEIAPDQEITRRMTNPNAPDVLGAKVEYIGQYRVFGTREVVGDTVERRIGVLARVSGKTHATRDIREFANLLLADAKSAGARQLRIIGEFVGNQNVLRIERFAKALGGQSRRVNDQTIEIILPVP